MKRRFLLITGGMFLGLAVLIYLGAININTNPSHRIGDIVDTLSGVPVYYNGGVNQSTDRNLSPEGYNIGLRYQCVEFVKRYYYERFAHMMPDSYGHAKDFYNHALRDGEINSRRNLIQYNNGSEHKPANEDIVVFASWSFNPYGHVAIISSISDDSVEIIQQNPGPFGASREVFPLSFKNGVWRIEHDRLLGWLRLSESSATPR